MVDSDALPSMGEAEQTAQIDAKSGMTSGYDMVQTTVQTAVVSTTGVILIHGLRLVTEKKALASGEFAD